MPEDNTRNINIYHLILNDNNRVKLDKTAR